MKIEIKWRTEDPNVSALALAAKISADYSLPLIPSLKRSEYWLKDWEGFSFEAKSLDAKIEVPKQQWDQSRDVATTILLIECDLRKLGLMPDVMINGGALIGYAVKQEKTVAKYRSGIEKAIQMLKDTSNWFKNRTFQNIRLFLEDTIKVPDTN